MLSQRLLFLCTGNSCRSQMAEGFGRALLPPHVEVYSAGVETHGLNPRAVAVMREAGIDISSHQSTLLTDLFHLKFDLVASVCYHAKERCPLFPGSTRVVHHNFPDPPNLAKDLHDEEEILGIYHEVRDSIRQWVLQLPINTLDSPD
jgi:arsenate reductase (thioredoxin)